MGVITGSKIDSMEPVGFERILFQRHSSTTYTHNLKSITNLKKKTPWAFCLAALLESLFHISDIVKYSF